MNHPSDLDIPPAPVVVRLDTWETTFGLIKSHIVFAHRVGDVLTRILDGGFVIQCVQQRELTGEEIARLYQEHTKRPYWNSLFHSVSGVVVLMALSGPHMVNSWRMMLGNTNSMMASQGTLRAEFGDRAIIANNVAHGSDSRESAGRELGIFFPHLLRPAPFTQR